MPRNSRLILLVASLLASQSLAYQWPQPQYEQLEQLLYEGTRADGSNIASIVHPCRKRTGTLSSIPAEWLRFVSCCGTHMSTMNLCDFRPFMICRTTIQRVAWEGSMHPLPLSWTFQAYGFSSYSLGEMLNNVQNFGLGFTDTQSDFESFPNKYVSRSSRPPVFLLKHFSIITRV